jgi:hypothetical protein
VKDPNPTVVTLEIQSMYGNKRTPVRFTEVTALGAALTAVASEIRDLPLEVEEDDNGLKTGHLATEIRMVVGSFLFTIRKERYAPQKMAPGTARTCTCRAHDVHEVDDACPVHGLNAP